MSQQRFDKDGRWQTALNDPAVAELEVMIVEAVSEGARFVQGNFTETRSLIFCLVLTTTCLGDNTPCQLE